MALPALTSDIKRSHQVFYCMIFGTGISCVNATDYAHKLSFGCNACLSLSNVLIGAVFILPHKSPTDSKPHSHSFVKCDRFLQLWLISLFCPGGSSSVLTVFAWPRKGRPGRVAVVQDSPDQFTWVRAQAGLNIFNRRVNVLKRCCR